MKDYLERTEKIYGSAAMERLQNAHVAIFGIGGVGCHAVEALARSGIGALDLVDGDIFVPSNLNRQLYALEDTLGQKKAEAAAERCKRIAPDCRVRTFSLFFDENTAGQFDFAAYDYVVDAIDSVPSKLLLIRLCREAGTPLIASMGTGGKTDPSKLNISDIYETSVDPLARVMRRECRKLEVPSLPVVWSTEEPRAPMPASTAFVPPAAGILLASYVVNELTSDRTGERSAPLGER